MRVAGERDGAGVRRELAVDEVEAGRLAGAVGSDQRDQLAGGDGERHVVDRAHAAEGLGECRRPASIGARSSACATRRRSRLRERAADAHRKHSTMAGSARRAARASIRCARASESASHVNAAAPSSGPNSALRPPSSTMTSASTERGIASDSGEMLPLENANRPPASPANTPASANAAPLRARARRCRAPRRAAASRARRAARSRTASARCASERERRERDDAPA